MSRKLNTFFFPFNFPLFCSFLGNFGPLGESYDESEALGEPLADETASESLAESQDEPIVVEPEQPPALYGAPAPPPPARA